MTASRNVPPGTFNDNPSAPQSSVHLSADTAAQIRAALVEALAHHGGDLEQEHEPGLPGELRTFEAQMRGALQALDGAGPGRGKAGNRAGPAFNDDAISLEASRALTLLDMARAALNEVDGVPDIWVYFEQTMHAHLARIEALADAPATIETDVDATNALRRLAELADIYKDDGDEQAAIVQSLRGYLEGRS